MAQACFRTGRKSGNTHTGVAVLDDMVWHVGGRVGKNPGPLTRESWIYHINSNKWTPGPQLTDPATGKPLPWAAGGVAFVGRTLHVFGGFIYNACKNDQSTYHLTLEVDEWLANPMVPAKWKNILTPMRVKRNHFSTVVLGGKIDAIGGQFDHDCNSAIDQQISHVYDPSTNTWTELPLLPVKRSHTEGRTFAIDGKIFVVGGQASSPNSNKVTIFDPAAKGGTGAWRDDTNLTLPAVFETVASRVIGNTCVLLHGGQPRNNNPRKATYTRTISRTPVYKFGFLPACSNLTANTGTSTKAKTLLFTIDGSKDYVLSSNVAWLSVSRNASGTAIQTAVDVEVTINTADLAPGTYSGIITATGSGPGPTYTSAQYCINLTVSSQPSYTATGTILREFWSGISGKSVASIPLDSTPTSTMQLISFASPVNAGSNYGQRLRGYLCPPTTGQYTFYIASDDYSELWLSTSDDPAQKIKIAALTGWANVKEWTKYSTQKSMSITLQAGWKYYIEALHTEEAGGDHVEVGWTTPVIQRLKSFLALCSLHLQRMPCIRKCKD